MDWIDASDLVVAVRGIGGEDLDLADEQFFLSALS
jgi:hypothetical protein